jgi:hypothetical protein
VDADDVPEASIVAVDRRPEQATVEHRGAATLVVIGYHYTEKPIGCMPAAFKGMLAGFNTGEKDIADARQDVGKFPREDI